MTQWPSNIKLVPQLGFDYHENYCIAADTVHDRPCGFDVAVTAEGGS